MASKKKTKKPDPKVAILDLDIDMKVDEIVIALELKPKDFEFLDEDLRDNASRYSKDFLAALTTLRAASERLASKK